MALLQFDLGERCRWACKRAGRGGGEKIVVGKFANAILRCPVTRAEKNVRAISSRPTCSVRCLSGSPFYVRVGYRKYLTWLNNGTHRSITCDWYHTGAARRDDACGRRASLPTNFGCWSFRHRLIATSVSLEGLTRQTVWEEWLIFVYE